MAAAMLQLRYRNGFAADHATHLLGDSQGGRLELQFLSQLLLGEDSPAHLQHGLEALFALDRVLLEAADREVFDLVLYPLPATAKSGDLSTLAELGLVLVKRLVCDGLLDVEDV